MSWYSLKARLARLRGKDAVRVKPRLRVPTYAAFEQVCLLVGLDPEEVRKGGARFTDARLVDPYLVGPRLLALTLENAGVVDLTRFERPAAEEFVAVVVAHFFVLATSTFSEQASALRTTLLAPASPASEAVAPTHRSVAP